MITIITVNYNGAEVTAELLESIARCSFTGEVIVVDNGSRLDEARMLRERFDWIVTIRSERNLGFAGGNNLALGVARGDLLFFLNNDTIVEPGFDVAIEEFMSTHATVGMMSPKILFDWDRTQIQYAGSTPLSKFSLRNRSIGFGIRDNWEFDEPRPTAYAHGAAMVVRREVIERVGGMNECYFLYYEELDWCEMIRNAGYEIWYAPVFRVFHKESYSTGKDSKLKTYYKTRNRLIFARIHFRGVRRVLSVAYQILIAVPVHFVRYAVRGRWDLAKAVFSGVKDSRRCGQ